MQAMPLKRTACGRRDPTLGTQPTLCQEGKSVDAGALCTWARGLEVSPYQICERIGKPTYMTCIMCTYTCNFGLLGWS